MTHDFDGHGTLHSDVRQPICPMAPLLTSIILESRLDLSSTSRLKHQITTENIHPHVHHNELLDHSHTRLDGHGLGLVVILDARRIGSANGPYRPLQTIHWQSLSYSRRVSPGHPDKILHSLGIFR
jgi:hypothetical protein